MAYSLDYAIFDSSDDFSRAVMAMSFNMAGEIPLSKGDFSKPFSDTGWIGLQVTCQKSQWLGLSSGTEDMFFLFTGKLGSLLEFMLSLAGMPASKLPSGEATWKMWDGDAVWYMSQAVDWAPCEWVSLPSKLDRLFQNPILWEQIKQTINASGMGTVEKILGVRLLDSHKFSFPPAPFPYVRYKSKKRHSLTAQDMVDRSYFTKVRTQFTDIAKASFDQAQIAIVSSPSDSNADVMLLQGSQFSIGRLLAHYAQTAVGGWDPVGPDQVGDRFYTVGQDDYVALHEALGLNIFGPVQHEFTPLDLLNVMVKGGVSADLPQNFTSPAILEPALVRITGERGWGAPDPGDYDDVDRPPKTVDPWVGEYVDASTDLPAPDPGAFMQTGFFSPLKEAAEETPAWLKIAAVAAVGAGVYFIARKR